MEFHAWHLARGVANEIGELADWMIDCMEAAYCMEIAHSCASVGWNASDRPVDMYDISDDWKCVLLIFS